jgi:DNA-binding XRE family transcriptional regulator
MDAETQKRLEADGWIISDVPTFLGLTEADMAYADLCIILSDAIKERRIAAGLTQQQLAERMGSSQSRVAKMESRHPGPSAGLLIRALFAIGVTLEELAEIISPELRAKVA